MKIEQINITNFGGLSNYTRDFTDGMNIIYGDNESGKSTVADFIYFIFYGFDKKEKTRYINFSGIYPSGNMIIENEGVKYSIERTSSSSGDSTSIIRLSDNFPYPKATSPTELFLSIPADVFRKTVYIRQSEGSSLGGSDVMSKIENLIFSADENINTENAIKKLDEYRVKYLHKNHAGGKLIQLRNEIDKLKSEQLLASEDNARLLYCQNQLEKTEADLDRQRSELLNYDIRYNYIENNEILKDFETKRETENQIARLFNSRKKLLASNTRNGYIPDEKYRDAVKNSKSKLELIEESFRAADDEYKSLLVKEKMISDSLKDEKSLGMLYSSEETTSLISKNEFKEKTYKILGFVSAIIFLIFTTTSVISLVQQNTGFSVLFLILTGLALLSTIFFYFAATKPRNDINNIFRELNIKSKSEIENIFTKYNEKENEHKNVSAETDAAERRYKETLTNMNLLKSSIALLLEKWNCSNLDSALRDCEKFLEEINSIDSQLVMLNNQLNILKVRLAQYDENDIKATVESYEDKYKALNIENELTLTELKKQRDRYAKAYDLLRTQKHNIDIEIAELTQKVRDPGEIADKITELLSEYDIGNIKHKALVLAMDTLNDASHNLRSSLSPKISERTRYYFSALTNGKYNFVNVDDSLDLSYGANAESDKHSVSFLSAGTSDAVYIALRLALSDLLSEEKNMPLIFDEAFCRIDDNRLKAVIEVLKKAGQSGRQVIIFTSQHREGTLCG